MARTFYTERDIVDLVRQGVSHLKLELGDRITDVARERAIKEGLKLEWPDEALTAAPHRYPPLKVARTRGARTGSPSTELHDRVRASVIAKLGGEADPGLVDDIIQRVFRQLGVG